MSSYCYGGDVQMIPNRIVNPNNENDYPFVVPTVFLEGICEEYMPQYDYSWCRDSVVVIRKNIVTRYNTSCFTELLAEDESGNIVWIDGRDAPYPDCWKGKYLGERRSGMEITVEEFDIEKSEKRKYKVTLAETTPLNNWDIQRLSNYIDIKQSEDKKE